MPDVIRLVTHAELEEATTNDRQLSVSARLEAVLADGRSVVLLDDRGWSQSGPPGIRRYVTAEQIEATARTVVGPDEPFGGRTWEQMEDDHWGHLAGLLRHRGVDVTGGQLARLPHDVVLGERLRAWLA
ncbi:hypothetical protein [Streptomyces marincola]|uniref:Uncharacterized protein n=1 Tax=Streptomyces marincola TaxID=2878388 RepID=A0A1W7CZQ9_9ACTN|nr:hypothetical protein [Streptomyces marincola]ARQ70293.1 hypothetical protein CAG99_16875 [Streptomyces marincola]